MSPQQQATLAQQSQQWRQRAGELDRDNQELESLVAQQRQQISLLNDEVQATRQQLSTAAKQLETSLANNADLKQRTEALTASVTRRVGAEIRPNNSLVKDLAIASMPGIEVRADGEVIRVEIPSSQIFQARTAHFGRGASVVLRSIAAELMRKYPEHIMGIEAHTDSEPIRSSSYASNTHLTVAQAIAVFEYLTRSAGMPPQQAAFVVGHGGNHPVVSNATPAGKGRNRRVELVVYPDKLLRP